MAVLAPRRFHGRGQRDPYWGLTWNYNDEWWEDGGVRPSAPNNPSGVLVLGEGVGNRLWNGWYIGDYMTSRHRGIVYGDRFIVQDRAMNAAFADSRIS